MARPEIAALLFDLIQAPVRWRVVETALELELFEQARMPVAASDVAAALSLDVGRTTLVLNALCAMGLLETRHGRYVVAAEAAPYVLRGEARCLRDLLLTLPKVRHGDVGRLLRHGDAGAVLDMSDPAFWDRSAHSLRAFHRGMALDVALAVLQALPGWPLARSFLDLGAGSEVLAREVAGRCPDMAVTVFDLPPMAARISAALADGPAGRRIQVLAGDFNDADLGGPHDVIWAAMTLYYARDLVEVLRSVRGALAPGGVFVSFHEGLDAARTGPEIHVLGRLVPSLRGQDRSFERGQIAAAMAQVGFTRLESRPVDTPFGPMLADMGYAP